MLTLILQSWGVCYLELHRLRSYRLEFIYTVGKAFNKRAFNYINRNTTKIQAIRIYLVWIVQKLKLIWSIYFFIYVGKFCDKLLYYVNCVKTLYVDRIFTIFFKYFFYTKQLIKKIRKNRYRNISLEVFFFLINIYF